MSVCVNACAYVNTDAGPGVNPSLWNVNKYADRSARPGVSGVLFSYYRDSADEALRGLFPSNRQAARQMRAGGMDCARQGRSTRTPDTRKRLSSQPATRSLEAISKSDGPRCPFRSRTVVPFYKETEGWRTGFGRISESDRPPRCSRTRMQMAELTSISVLTTGYKVTIIVPV